MSYDPTRHRRRSIRLKGYDYRLPGAYFVTICTHERTCLFGRIAGGDVLLNAFGHVADAEWRRTARVRPNVILDAFVVMPNHVHGIIGIVAGPDDTVAPVPRAVRRDTPPVCPYGPHIRRRFARVIVHHHAAI